jgi:hypothetical protein
MERKQIIYKYQLKKYSQTKKEAHLPILGHQGS